MIPRQSSPVELHHNHNYIVAVASKFVIVISFVHPLGYLKVKHGSTFRISQTQT